MDTTSNLISFSSSANQPVTITSSTFEQISSEETTTLSNDTSSLYIIPTFVGVGIALFGIVLTLLSYLGSRKLLVKRTHIILVNLCLCLLVYFLAYAISNYERHYSKIEEKYIPLCAAGAFLSHLSVLSSWFWIGSYWLLILLMYQRPLRNHVHHFFIKAILPCYGIPLIAAVVSIAVASSMNHIKLSEKEKYYLSERCFIAHNYLWAGLAAPFGLVGLAILAIFIYIVFGLLKKKKVTREGRNKKRVKTHLLKLTIITVLAAAVFLSTVIFQTSYQGDGKSDAAKVATIIFVIFSVALGILLLILFCLLQTDIRLHWSSVITGSTHLKHRQSLSTGKCDGISNLSSRKFSSNSRQLILQVDQNLNNERKSSTMKMVPKDDADFSTLGLIQIPSTPTSEDQKRKNIKHTVEEDSSSIDNNSTKIEQKKEKNKKADKRSSKTPQTDENKSTQHKMSTSSFDGSDKTEKKDKLAPSRFLRGNKDGKRRSFSTSSIKPDSGKQLSLLKRQSVMSNDSTRMTSFD